MVKAPKVVVVGSVNTDMVVKAQRIPSPGETITGGTFVMPPGGKGANQAVAAARLGAKVTLVAKVGDDLLGKQSVENFEKEGIDTEYILTDPRSHTGVALILVDAEGENIISVAPGANFEITPEEVEAAAERIRSADAVLLQLEIPLPAVATAARLAAEAGVPVILDPAPAAPLDDALLANVAYLTPNESEAQRLTGIAVDNEPSARRAAENLLARGVRHVIVTLGSKGALLAGGERMRLIASRPVEATDSTAAGDAFNGGLAAALGRGAALEDAVAEACLVGALSATRMGAQPSLPGREQLRRFAQQANA